MTKFQLEWDFCGIYFSFFPLSRASNKIGNFFFFFFFRLLQLRIIHWIVSSWERKDPIGLVGLKVWTFKHMYGASWPRGKGWPVTNWLPKPTGYTIRFHDKPGGQWQSLFCPFLEKKKKKKKKKKKTSTIRTHISFTAGIIFQLLNYF